MPVYKVLFSFFQRKQGWTETYYLNTAGPNLQQVYNEVLPLASKRALLCGAECQLDAIRVSDVMVKNDSFLQYVPFTGVATEQAAPPDDALLVRMAVQENTQFRQLYLRGIYDGLAQNGGAFINNYPAFAQNWPAYIGELLQRNYGWFGVDRPNQKSSVSLAYTQQPDGTVRITTVLPIFPALLVGSRTVVRVSRFNNSTSELNGSQVVYVDAPNQMTTVDRMSVFPFLTPGRVTYSPLVYQRIANVLPMKIVSRRVGAPLLASRGRRKARARG